jgi:site-specific recombinase XerD
MMAYTRVVCGCGCGEEFQRRKSDVNPGDLNYVSVQHAGAHRSRIYLEDTCGPFLGIVTEYLDGFATHHYKNLGTIRAGVCPFILFLNERGITNLERVTSKTITEFIAWSEEVEYKNAAHNISVLKGFFQWANRHGYRTSSCPVVPKFHGKKRPQYLPRPYPAEEMALIWRLANERGNSRVRAVLAIGEEAGLRLGEICRLREQDIDLEGRRLFVRLPNKTDCERWAPFSEKAARYIAAWRLDRDENCDHNSLFHNSVGGSPLPETMHRELCRTFCRAYAGETIHSEGLDEWSTHRLRHTMASNLASGGASIATIMGAGGWRSVSSMLIYTKNDEGRARRGYDEAMRRANEQADVGTSKRVLSLDEFLVQCGDQE